MGLRLLDNTHPANVIPLCRKEDNYIGAGAADVPEPAQLYGLVVLAFLLHTGEPGGWCSLCDVHWPCPHLCLAFRIREGF